MYVRGVSDPRDIPGCFKNRGRRERRNEWRARGKVRVCVCEEGCIERDCVCVEEREKR